MPPDYSELRCIPLKEVMAAMGLRGNQEGQSTIYRFGNGAINVTGTKWFDHQAGIGGGGAIDLTMHLLGSTSAEAVEWLRGRFALSAVLDTSTTLVKSGSPSLPPERPFHELMDEFARRSETHWLAARHYLVNRRKLPAHLVDALHQEGTVFAHNRGGVVFLHRNECSRVEGASIRDLKTPCAFRQTIGNKVTAWFSCGVPIAEARSMAITESPIDALSYFAMATPALRDGLTVVSVAGNHVPTPLLRYAAEGAILPILALDGDEAGRLGEESASFRWREIAKEVGLTRDLPVRRPSRKDWNEELATTNKHRHHI
jgi:hypothetical protein